MDTDKFRSLPDSDYAYLKIPLPFMESHTNNPDVLLIERQKKFLIKWKKTHSFSPDYNELMKHK